ncbi:hypothetical protein [Aminobacter sp. MSH1]|nr:hypothetical protein [Aminobacter sp. MSH1]
MRATSTQHHRKKVGQEHNEYKKLKRGWEKDLKLEQSTRAKPLKNWRE